MDYINDLERSSLKMDHIQLKEKYRLLLGIRKTQDTQTACGRRDSDLANEIQYSKALSTIQDQAKK